MHRRRTTALLVALVAAVPLLSSCSASGRDAATSRINQIVTGADNRDAAVDVLNAAIVANADGSGTFIATFVNNSVEADNTVTGLSSPAGLDVADFSDISVPPGGLVSLADDGGVVVSGDFKLGQYVEVEVDLGDGSTVPLNVPVVADSGYWSGLDKS